MDHYHAWLRSGRIYTMASRKFTDRSTARKWAQRKRPDANDRMVLSCETCPTSKPSRRRPMRWGQVARRLAAVLDADPARVRAALDDAVAAERERSAGNAAALG